jgi:hypothetical protein
MADSPPLRSAPKLLLFLKPAAAERVAVSPLVIRAEAATCRNGTAGFLVGPFGDSL